MQTRLLGLKKLFLLFSDMPLVIPLKQTNDVDLVKPVSSFLNHTFEDLGADVTLQMARELDNQRRIACVKGKNTTCLFIQNKIINLKLKF